MKRVGFSSLISFFSFKIEPSQNPIREPAEIHKKIQNRSYICASGRYDM